MSSKDRWFNQSQADRFVRFAAHCKHTKGQWAGEPFHILPFQQDYIDQVYGWYIGEKRETRTAFYSLSRGNGKTHWASLIAAFELFCNDEFSPYTLIASATLESADLIFNDVVEFILANPKLHSDKVKIVASDHLIEYRKKGMNKSVLRAIACDRRNAHGKDITCCLLDEAHLMERKHGDFITALKYSMKNRKNPIMQIFTTAGIMQEGPAWDLYQHAKGIKEGRIKDASFKPFIWESDDTYPIDDERCWLQSNPAMEFGIVDKDMFRQQLEEAKHNSTELAKFCYMKLNRWVQSSGAFLDPVAFDACKRPYPNLQGLPCVIGIDPASVGNDLFGIVALIEVDGIYYTKTWGITSEKGLLAHGQTNLLDYSGWKDEGLLIVHDGNTIELDKVTKLIDSINATNPVKAIVIEKYLEMGWIQGLQTRYNVVEHPPRPEHYHTPTQKLSRMIANRTLAHDGNSLLRHSMVNLEVKEHKGNLLMPNKRNKHSSNKNDLAVACILAINAIETSDRTTPKKSIYDDRQAFWV